MFTPPLRHTQLANSAHHDSHGPYFVQLLPAGCSPVPSCDLAIETILARVGAPGGAWARGTFLARGEPLAGGGAGLPLPPVPPCFLPVCRLTPIAFMVMGP